MDLNIGLATSFEMVIVFTQGDGGVAASAPRECHCSRAAAQCPTRAGTGESVAVLPSPQLFHLLEYSSPPQGFAAKGGMDALAKASAA